MAGTTDCAPSLTAWAAAWSSLASRCAVLPPPQRAWHIYPAHTQPTHTHTHTHTHSNMSSIRPPAEEGALVEALGEAAKQRDVKLVIGPWRDTAAQLAELEACS
jgi:hypothetical protein